MTQSKVKPQLRQIKPKLKGNIGARGHNVSTKRTDKDKETYRLTYTRKGR